MEVTEPESATPFPLLSLPEELLFCILEHLDDTDLYQHFRTCRTLHHTALHTLFNRYCKTISSGTLTLQTTRPPYLLRALHGALFVQDIQHITISFSDDISQFYAEARLLTELIDKVKCNKSLEISMALVAATHPSCISLEELIPALQHLMDAALKKGCTFMSIITNPWLKSLYGGPSRITPPAASPKKGSRLSGFVKQLGSILSGKALRRSSILESKEVEEPVSPTPDIDTAVVPAQPPPPTFAHQNVMARGAFIISTDLLLEPLFLDWTLSLLNTSGLTKLCFTTKNFAPNALQKFLPQLTMPCLEVFAVSARRHDLELNDLVQFAQRHSKTLTTFTFGTSAPEFITPEQPPDDSPPVYMNLPKLSSVVLSSCYYPWFVKVITSDPTKGDPPHLSDLLILVTEDRPNVPTLDEALESLAELGKSKPKGYRFSYWLSTLTFGAKQFDAAVFIKWLKTFSDKHNRAIADLVTGQEDTPESGPESGLDADPSNPETPTEPPSIITYPTVRVLNIEMSNVKPYHEEELYKVLPGFLALFPNLFRLRVGQVTVETGKKRKAEYWKGIAETCPKLQFVRFSSGTTRFTGEEVLMKDLLAGKFEYMDSSYSGWSRT